MGLGGKSPEEQTAENTGKALEYLAKLVNGIAGAVGAVGNVVGSDTSVLGSILAGPAAAGVWLANRRG